MSNDYRDPKFKTWLDQLQQESWQLELIISGFAIYGLFLAYEPLSLSVKLSQDSQHIHQFLISFIALLACGILIFNLILHVVLRGLWIGALGLRYVSGEIDYDKLKYSPRFTKYLKKKVGSFDRYIATLENYCSVLFAISFLLIFYVVAFTLTILAMLLVAVYLMDDELSYHNITGPIGVAMILFILLGMFLTFIDFIGQGILKKNKWISRIYFPVYWVFSFITLSFLYRPLVYNFLDNKFGKRLMFILIPIYVLILILTTVKYEPSNYLVQDADKTSSSTYANSRNYEDMLVDDEDLIKDVAIPSKVITVPFLKVFVAYNENIENNIFSFNKGLKPEKDERGIKTGLKFTSDITFRSSRRRDSLLRAYLKTFNAIYEIQIDTIDYDSDFIIAKSLKDEMGFETYVPLNDLEEGRHFLKVKRKRIRQKDTVKHIVAGIPFWYYRD
jgi:hypothetical protein